MKHASLLNQDWRHVVDRLGGAPAIEASARATKAFQRARGVLGAVVLLRLVLAYCLRQGGLRSTAAWASAMGLADISNVALLNRLRGCGDWLAALVGCLLAAAAPAASRGRLVRLIDATAVAKPGAAARRGNGVWRIHSAFDLPAERFAFFEVTEERGGERFDRIAVEPGEIRVADRAYMQPERIAAVLGGRRCRGARRLAQRRLARCRGRAVRYNRRAVRGSRARLDRPADLAPSPRRRTAAGAAAGRCQEIAASRQSRPPHGAARGAKEKLWGERRGSGTFVAVGNRRGCPMPQPNDLSRSLTALDQDSTLIAVVEMSQSSWLVGGIIPGVERHPAKKLAASETLLLSLLHRWREEAAKAGRAINRIAVAFEAGRDGFWLARWLQARDVEAHVIHATSIAVSREHRRAKTDRLDAVLLKRAFLGWLRGERGHCSMVAVPSLEEEDAKRPSRERESLVGERTRIGNRVKSALARLGIRGFKPGLRKSQERLEHLRTPEGVALPPNTLAELRRDIARLRLINEQIGQIEAARAERLRQQPDQARHPMILLLARVIGIGIETADMLVQEVLSRKLRDRRAVARYGGLTGSPEESGARRREKGLAKAGNARVRRGMLQLAWRFLMFQKDSSLAQWYRARTADARGATRKTMIVALARKLLIALWKLVTTGEVPQGVLLRSAIPAAV